MQIAETIFSLLDLTRLNHTDTVADIKQLAQEAAFYTDAGQRIQAAGLCVLPRFVPYAREFLNDLHLFQVRLATVANFPEGDASVERAYAETKACIAYGADEVDLMFPYQAFLADFSGSLGTGFSIHSFAEPSGAVHAKQLIQACKEACGSNAQLKVILETSQLQSHDAKLAEDVGAKQSAIQAACQIAIEGGADFIKTSTGFPSAQGIKSQATPKAVQAILEVIAAQDASHQFDKPLKALGIKVSGGLQTQAQAEAYLQQIEQALGKEALTPARVRFGASALHKNLF